MSVVNLNDLVIATGETDSNIIDTANGIWDLIYGFVVISPTTLIETVKIHVCETLGGTYQALQSGGADITFPASKATTITLVGFRFFKLVSGSGVAAPGRTFKVTGREQYMGKL